jgi:hypothetical protein
MKKLPSFGGETSIISRVESRNLRRSLVEVVRGF